MASDTTITPGFRRHASPQAIEDRIDDLRRQGNRIKGARRTLEGLLDERMAQIEAGEWPPRRPVEDQETTGVMEPYDCPQCGEYVFDGGMCPDCGYCPPEDQEETDGE